MCTGSTPGPPSESSSTTRSHLPGPVNPLRRRTPVTHRLHRPQSTHHLLLSPLHYPPDLGAGEPRRRFSDSTSGVSTTRSDGLRLPTRKRYPSVSTTSHPSSPRTFPVVHPHLRSYPGSEGRPVSTRGSGHQSDQNVDSRLRRVPHRKRRIPNYPLFTLQTPVSTTPLTIVVPRVDPKTSCLSSLPPRQ